MRKILVILLLITNSCGPTLLHYMGLQEDFDSTDKKIIKIDTVEAPGGRNLKRVKYRYIK